MSYAKLDDLYDDNRKVKRAWRAHPRAVGLHAMAITYCARHRTDGVVDPEWIADRLPHGREKAAVLNALVDCRLFTRLDDGRYLVHDYLDWNESRAERQALSEAKRIAGRKGGRARAAAADTPSTNGAAAQANGQAGAKQVLDPAPSSRARPPHHTTPLTTTSSLRSDVVAANGDEGEGEEEDAPARLDAARDRLHNEAVDRIWDAYDETRRAVLGDRSVAKLSAARRQLIARRLKEWPEPDLLDAVRGWRHSEHNRGENERGQPYCDIELLLRDAAHIERFRDLERAAGNGRRATDPETPLWLRKQREAAAVTPSADGAA